MPTSSEWSLLFIFSKTIFCMHFSFHMEYLWRVVDFIIWKKWHSAVTDLPELSENECNLLFIVARMQCFQRAYRTVERMPIWWHGLTDCAVAMRRQSGWQSSWCWKHVTEGFLPLFTGAWLLLDTHIKCLNFLVSRHNNLKFLEQGSPTCISRAACGPWALFYGPQSCKWKVIFEGCFRLIKREHYNN
jgi:hypothetical protein